MKDKDGRPAALRNIDLNLLKVFSAIISEKTIGQAAIVLCVSQPAVSNALRRLRELYNDPLFTRTAHGMVPTAKAKSLSRPIREALLKIEKTVGADDKFQPETSQRRFTIALTDYGEFFFLPPIVRQLAIEAPGVEVVCVPSLGASLTLEMKSGAIDLAWDWIPINDSNFSSQRVFEDRGFCLARKGHPVVDSQLSLEAFLELEHVVQRATRNRNPQVERELEERGLQRKVVVEVSNLLMIPQVVENSDLIAIMPARLAFFFAQHFGLQVVPNPLYDNSVSVYQYWHLQFKNDEGHHWFRDLVKRVVADN